MANIVNSSGSSPQRSNASYTPSSCPTSSAMVSPNIVEAIDRIFSNSPSQLLQQNSFSDGVSGSLTGKNSLSDGILPSPSPYTISTLPCTISMANITTHTTTTATAVFTNLSTTSGTTSPVMSLVPTNHMDIPATSAQTKINSISHKNGTVDLNTTKTGIPVKRISKADLEIMNNLPNDSFKQGKYGWETDSPRRDSNSIELSDSDDMCRPFVTIQKEKKKRKRKHLACEQMKTMNSDTSGSFCHDPETQISKISKFATFQSPNNSEENIFHADDKSCDLAQSVNANQVMNDSEVSGDTSVSNDVSNTNTDSCSPKIQVMRRKKSHRQMLPKTKRFRFHFQKDGRAIRKLFPPCYVVLKRFQEDLDAQSLTLRERVNVLLSLCEQNKISCATKWKASMLTNFKNIHDNSLSDNSEDEFKLARGRSLRRRQNICYVEPTEDDLMEDITSHYHHSVPSKSHDLVKEVSQDGDTDSNAKGKVSRKKVKLQVSPSNDNGHVVQERKNKPSQDSDESQVLDLSKPSPPKDIQSAKSKSSHPGESAQNKSLKDAKESAVTKTTVGPNLVYVYPKTTILSNIQAGVGTNVTSGHSSSTKTKSSVANVDLTSRTNSSRSDIIKTVTVASVSNLVTYAGAKRSILSPFFPNLSERSIASSSTLAQSVPIMTTSTSVSSVSQKSTVPTNLCMIKIAGKDYLLSMPSNSNIRGAASSVSNNRSHITSLSLAGQHPLIYQANAGIRSASLSQGSVGVSPAFSLPVQNSSITMSAAIRTHSSSTHQNSSLSPASLLLEKSNLTNSPNVSVFNQSLLATTSLSTPPIIMVSKQSRVEVTSSSSRVSSTPSSTAQEKRTSSSATNVSTQATNIVVHQCPSLTTSGLSSTGQVGAPNASIPGARCFRIIVPACSGAGSGTRIATLGTAFSSPLSRLTASSALLPQKKQNSHLTPEQLAAKRKKLEKKYPLPPGVTIKTEPLENPSQSSSVVSSGSVRSLLSSQNIQLIAASSRSAVGGVQRFRIIAPSTAGFSVGSRPLRFGSNVIIRAPVINAHSSRTQSSLLTAVSTSSTVSTGQSLVNMTSNSTTTSGDASSSNSVITHLSPITSTAVSTCCSASLSTASSSCSTISLLSSANLLLNSQSNPVLHSGSSSLPFASTTSNFVFTQPSSASTILSPSTSKETSQATSDSQRGFRITSCFSTLPPENLKDPSPRTTEGDKLKQSIESLVKLISEQEALGLKGQRLEKLRELLTQKEKSLSELEKESDESQSNADSDSAFVTSSQDPVVID